MKFGSLQLGANSGAMEDTPGGLTDKLYWHKARKQWHCFKKIAQVRGFISLCQRQEITSVRGKESSRPEVALRCEVCDRLEMERRGWKAQVRFNPGGASADDVSLHSEKTRRARLQNDTHDHARSSRSGVSCDLRESVLWISPHIMLERDLYEAEHKSPVPRLYMAECSINCFNSARGTVSSSPARKRFDREHNLLPKTKPKIHHERILLKVQRGDVTRA